MNDIFVPRKRLRCMSISTVWWAPQRVKDGTAYLVSASLFLFSKLWPCSAPLSFDFIMPSDCRVGKTASLSCPHV